jgi:hypothetical protein
MTAWLTDKTFSLGGCDAKRLLEENRSYKNEIRLRGLLEPLIYLVCVGRLCSCRRVGVACPQDLFNRWP